RRCLHSLTPRPEMPSSTGSPAWHRIASRSGGVSRRRDGLPCELRSAARSWGAGDRAALWPTEPCATQLVGDPRDPLAEREGTEPARISRHAANDLASRRQSLTRVG